MNNPLLAILVNHLWQSTLFVVAIGGLTLLLRRNSARVRYWLWLAASIKFLVPFALLAAIGAQIPWRPAVGEQGAATPRLLELAGDFTAPMAGEFPFPGAETETAAAAADWQLVTVLMFLVWATGATFVAVRWLLRWLEIRRALRKSVALADIDFPAPVRATTKQFEPGVVGIIRPALLLPAGIEERLTHEQMRAILAHERCHLRWRDNLTASLHMLVEAVFWFYPPVWWIGARLIEERERDCDEQVIRDGHAKESYAEGILAVCEHYIASRLPCVSGVSGSDLRKRIESILKNALAVKLDRPKKFALASIACCMVTAPIAAGIVSGGTMRVLFSLGPSTTAMLQYMQFSSASAELMTSGVSGLNAGLSGGEFSAWTCPAPSATVIQKQKMLAATVARLSPTDGDKVLLYAVAANSTADVQRLLAGGAPRNGDGVFLEDSLMHIAARFGDVRMLEVLANAGFGIDGLSSGGIASSLYTPLMAAISSGRRDNVDWFIQHGADVNGTNRADWSALLLAMISCGDQNLVAQLARAGARPNDKAQRVAARLGFDLGADATSDGSPGAQ